MNHVRYFPDMGDLVVGADGETGSACRDDSLGALHRIEFFALDVHANIGRLQAVKGLIQRDGLHHVCAVWVEPRAEACRVVALNGRVVRTGKTTNARGGADGAW